MVKILKVILYIVVLVFILFGIGALFLYNFSTIGIEAGHDTSSKYTDKNTVITVLSKENTAFTRAMASYSIGDYRQAQEFFTTALKSAKDPEQKGQIMYLLAQSKKFSGDSLGAIQEYKEIIAEKSFTPIIKAYSLQNMSNMYYESGDVSIQKEIFKDPPYTAMVVANNPDLSFMHLYEYASSFYPLGMSEMHVAESYANELNSRFAKPTATSSVVTEAYVKIIQEKIIHAEADIRRISDITQEKNQIPAILTREALVKEKLARFQHTSFDDTEATFKRAFDMYSALGQGNGIDGFTRYFYASLLANYYNGTRDSDTITLLTPFYTTNTYANSSAEQFFKTEKNNQLRAKGNIVKLALVDSKFKSYLMTLGWTSADFLKK